MYCDNKVSSIRVQPFLTPSPHLRNQVFGP